MDKSATPWGSIYNNIKDFGEAESIKPFDKDAWLQKLAVEIDEEAELLKEYTDPDQPLVYAVSIESLQDILAKYFPKIKLIQWKLQTVPKSQ